MKTKFILFTIGIVVLMGCIGLSQNSGDFKNDKLGDKNYLTLTPDLSNAALKDGYVRIPFTVRNNYTEDIIIAKSRDMIDGLMTIDGSGKRGFIEYFRTGNPAPGGGPIPDRIVLKPGQSKIYQCKCSMETLGFISDRNMTIFGAITGRLASSDQPFQSYSEPFPVPPRLARPPWIDLGGQSYFSVVPDPTKTEIQAGVIDGALLIYVPVKITNITVHSCIAATDSVTFYIVRKGSKGIVPSPWETIKALAPILNPGESATSTGSSYIISRDLDSQGYKSGNKLIAAVGGRIPNTNQIFDPDFPNELPS
jgi:hypothetical protein